MATRIGLISDTHIPEARDSLWPQIADAFSGVDMIFHAGDIHDLWVLDELEKSAPIYAARGNGEDGSGGRPVQPQDDRVKYAWTLHIEGLTIGLTHYVPVPERPPNFTLERWIERFFPDEKPDVIVSGDTHQERIMTINDVYCVNPGSALYPHNYDTQFGTIGYLDLDNGKADASIFLLQEQGLVPYDWDNPPKWQIRRS